MKSSKQLRLLAKTQIYTQANRGSRHRKPPAHRKQDLKCPESEFRLE